MEAVCVQVIRHHNSLHAMLLHHHDLAACGSRIV
jgi:hypothetical protein